MILQFEHPLPESDDDEDYIDTGAAILNFYCTLVDLLGRCAPDSSVIEQGKIVHIFIIIKKFIITGMLITFYFKVINNVNNLC